MSILPKFLRAIVLPELYVRVNGTADADDPIRVRVHGAVGVAIFDDAAAVYGRPGEPQMEVLTPAQFRVEAGRDCHLTFEPVGFATQLEVHATGGPRDEFSAQGDAVTLWRSLGRAGIRTHSA